jgi:hypothetical protein
MMGSADFLAQARTPVMGLCFDYWRSKGDGSRLPGRQHLQMEEMRAFLPFVILFDVVCHGGAYRFRQRLVGTHIVELFGRDTTGQFVDETSAPDHCVPVQARLTEIVETASPRFGVYHPPFPHLDFLEYEHLTLPLASDGRSVDMLFGVRCGLDRTQARAAS